MRSLLPIGIQSFEDIRTSGYKYVDKTERMYQLTHTFKFVFLSRPRRFGKSLLVSTLDAYFKAKKDLFEGLAIENLEKDWTEYPVLHLDLNIRNYNSREALLNELDKHLRRWEKIYGNEYQDKSIEERFEQIILLAQQKTGKKVVVLVDEYDKPLISTITKPELQDEYRAILKSFYTVLKTCGEQVRFALLTGVTKFSKVSVFSDLNNLKDISMLENFYDICGITDSELKNNFQSNVESLAKRQKFSTEEGFLNLKKHYDGYRFTSMTTYEDDNGEEKQIEGIYNPFSLLNALSDKDFKSYWFETGTPTFLIEKLQSEHYAPKDLDGIMVSDSAMGVTYQEDLSLIQYFFQTGYLTIKDYDQRLGLYTLGYPNKEVKQGFLNCLAAYYAKPSPLYSQFDISNFVLSLEAGNVEEFIDRLKAFLASIPYEMIPDSERHVQNVIYLLSTLCGFYCEVESHTNKGRIDMTIKTPKYIYIFELKYDVSAQEALNQIREKGYAEKFSSDPRELICVGINYSSTDRNISDWLVG